MKDLDAAFLGGRLHHNGDPVLTWAMSCVVARVDAKDNVFPRKIENGKDKIDPAVALITGINQAMQGEVKRRYTTPMIGIL
jgi:phage terminase large subunit-like protein